MNQGAYTRRWLCVGSAALAAIFLATGLVPRAFAQRPTLKQLMSFAFPDELTAAAHGERVAWVFNIEGVRNVWVADGPGFNDARPVTHYREDDGRPIASLRLTPNGRTVVYARGSELNDQGEVADPNSLVIRPQQEVWAVDVDSGGQPRLLGKMDCQSEGCEDIRISPNGQMAAWAARGRIWVAPISGGFTAQAIGYVRGNNSDPRWSPNSEEIAFESDRGDHSFIAIYNFASREIHYMHPSFDRDELPRWSPDGRQIAFIRLPGIENKQPIIPLHVTQWAIWVGNPQTGAAHRIYDQNGNTLNDSYDWLHERVSFHFMSGNRIIFAGNMDGSEVHLKLPSKKIIPLGGYSAGLIHGKYKIDIQREMIMKEFSKVDLIVYGHSHMPFWGKFDNVYFLNPGSPTDKRYAPYNSVALLHVGDELTAEIIRL